MVNSYQCRRLFWILSINHGKMTVGQFFNSPNSIKVFSKAKV